jgi:hypothetical protein
MEQQKNTTTNTITETNTTTPTTSEQNEKTSPIISFSPASPYDNNLAQRPRTVIGGSFVPFSQFNPYEMNMYLKAIGRG